MLGRARRAVAPCLVGGRCALGLYADDRYVRPQRLRHERGARRAAAAADRNDEHVDVGPLGQDLERRGADPGDEVWLVARVHVAQATGSGAALALLPRVVVIVPMLDDR